MFTNAHCDGLRKAVVSGDVPRQFHETVKFGRANGARPRITRLVRISCVSPKDFKIETGLRDQRIVSHRVKPYEKANQLQGWDAKR